MNEQPPTKQPKRDLESRSLEVSLARLSEIERDHLALFKAMGEVYGGAIYGMDFLVWGAMNRSKALIAGFRALVQARNLICAGALLRLELDTALRVFAAFLVEKPHDFALAILQGQHVRDLCDQSGKKLTDSYLVAKLEPEFPWIRRVYDRTSVYVHLSSVHIMSALTLSEGEGEQGRFEVKLSEVDKPLPESLYIEACDAFCAASDILLQHVRGWIFTKANPEVVANLKVQREAPRPENDAQPSAPADTGKAAPLS